VDFRLPITPTARPSWDDVGHTQPIQFGLERGLPEDMNSTILQASRYHQIWAA
jgi:hypothetical protein